MIRDKPCCGRDAFFNNAFLNVGLLDIFYTRQTCGCVVPVVKHVQVSNNTKFGTCVLHIACKNCNSFCGGSSDVTALKGAAWTVLVVASRTPKRSERVGYGLYCRAGLDASMSAVRFRHFLSSESCFEHSPYRFSYRHLRRSFDSVLTILSQRKIYCTMPSQSPRRTLYLYTESSWDPVATTCVASASAPSPKSDPLPPLQIADKRSLLRRSKSTNSALNWMDNIEWTQQKGSSSSTQPRLVVARWSAIIVLLATVGPRVLRAF